MLRVFGDVFVEGVKIAQRLWRRIECALQAEAVLGFIVWNAFGSVELSQSSFDFGQEYEPLNGVVDGSVWRHCLERLDYAIAGKWLQHGSIVMHISPQGRSIT